MSKKLKRLKVGLTQYLEETTMHGFRYTVDHIQIWQDFLLVVFCLVNVRAPRKDSRIEVDLKNTHCCGICELPYPVFCCNVSRLKSNCLVVHEYYKICNPRVFKYLLQALFG